MADAPRRVHFATNEDEAQRPNPTAAAKRRRKSGSDDEDAAPAKRPAPARPSLRAALEESHRRRAAAAAAAKAAPPLVASGDGSPAEQASQGSVRGGQAPVDELRPEAAPNAGPPVANGDASTGKDTDSGQLANVPNPTQAASADGAPGVPAGRGGVLATPWRGLGDFALQVFNALNGGGDAMRKATPKDSDRNVWGLQETFDRAEETAILRMIRERSRQPPAPRTGAELGATTGDLGLWKSQNQSPAPELPAPTNESAPPANPNAVEGHSTPGRLPASNSREEAGQPQDAAAQPKPLSPKRLSPPRTPAAESEADRALEAARQQKKAMFTRRRAESPAPRQGRRRPGRRAGGTGKGPEPLAAANANSLKPLPTQTVGKVAPAAQLSLAERMALERVAEDEMAWETTNTQLPSTRRVEGEKPSDGTGIGSVPDGVAAATDVGAQGQAAGEQGAASNEEERRLLLRGRPLAEQILAIRRILAPGSEGAAAQQANAGSATRQQNSAIPPPAQTLTLEELDNLGLDNLLASLNQLTSENLTPEPAARAPIRELATLTLELLTRVFPPQIAIRPLLEWLAATRTVEARTAQCGEALDPAGGAAADADADAEALGHRWSQLLANLNGAISQVERLEGRMAKGVADKLKGPKMTLAVTVYYEIKLLIERLDEMMKFSERAEERPEGTIRKSTH